MENPNEVLTVAQVADLLQIHRKTVLKHAENGTIPGKKLGGSWRFRRSLILKLLESEDGAQTPQQT